jgi:ATP synthase protein I
MKSDEFKDFFAALGLVTLLGLTMALSILLGVVLGTCIDRWLDTKPFFVSVFTVLGITGGTWGSYKEIRDVLHRNKHQQ